MERAALPGRLNGSPAPIRWRLGTVIGLREETSHAKSIRLDVPAWPGHVAGQHVDVRLTAEDGYQTERSYSIASAPEDAEVALTVERIEDGEVSPYLTEGLQPGDQLELRGPDRGLFQLAQRRRRPVAAGCRRLWPRAADGDASASRSNVEHSRGAPARVCALAFGRLVSR